MAFSPTDLARFEPHRQIGRGEVFWLPGDPGVTFTRGNAYIYTDGVLVAASDSSAGPHFYPTRTVTCAAASTPFTKPADLKEHDNATDETTLIPCTVGGLNAGTDVKLANYVNYQDETVVSYTASTRAIAMTTGLGADDRSQGSLVFIYEGPGAGEWNVIESYDHSGGAAALLMVCHRPFSATLTTSSKFIVLGSAAGDNPLHQFQRADLDAATGDIDCVDGGGAAGLTDGDGDLMVCASWQDLGEYGAIGQLPVINANSVQ